MPPPCVVIWVLTNSYLLDKLPPMQLIEYKRKHGAEAWQQLAEQAGTSVGYLNLLAYRQRQPSPDMAARLLRASGGQLTLAGLLPDLAAAASLRPS